MELAVCTLLVGVLMVAALRAAGQALLAQRKAGDRILGQSLAQSFIGEALAKRYADPTAVVPLIGPDLGESSAQRSTFDDIDDYDACTESPPRDVDGSALAGYSGWSRVAVVRWVNPATLADSLTDTGLKRIVVTATSGTNAISITAYRSSAP